MTSKKEIVVPVFSAVELAEEKDMTKQAIHAQIRKGKVRTVSLRYKPKGQEEIVIGKFYMSDEFQIIRNNQVVGQSEPQE